MRDLDDDLAGGNFTLSANQTLARLRAWFDEAVRLPEEDRAAWIEAHIADPEDRAALRGLLDADSGEGFLATPALELDARIVATEMPGPALIGKHIGAFKLVRELGQGGMATVFLGERSGADFEQRVAVKLLRRGLYSEFEQRLFQRERRVLASLAHPNIARLIDGGVTDTGVPYLAMEFVDGVPITEFVHEHKTDLRERLSLFADVCHAVETAHRNLIVHRDIKPSNILVGADGTPKLLDFGIAKLVDDHVDAVTHGGAYFTPGYAAPEQLRGGTITTATDVYGLGVLLFELLLGCRPDTDGNDSVPRRPSSQIDPANARGAPAASPEELRRKLRGDLDNIVQKALDSDPARRYASAGALADDVMRHLAGRPVLAHPPTGWYRAKKFVQRHRGGVTVTAILVLAVFAALGVALWQANLARREARAARIEAAKATQIADFAGQMLSSVDPNRAKSMDRSLMHLILDSAATNAQASLAGQPAVRASIEEIIAASYASISEFASADAHFEQAQQAARAAGLENAVQARLATQRAAALFGLGDRREDARVQDRLAVELSAALPEDHRDRIHAETVALAHECHWRPQAECSARFARISALARRALPDNDPIMLRVLKGQIVADAAAQRYTESGALRRELVERNRAIYGAEDSRTLEAVRNLASFDGTNHGNNLDEGERLLRENLPIAQRVLGAEHAITIEMTYDLGRNLSAQKRYVEAKPLLLHALTSMTTLNGAQAISTITADYTLTQTLLALNELADAEQHARARIATEGASGHGDHGIFRTLLARILVAQKRYSEAEQELNAVHAAQANEAGVAPVYVALYEAWNKPEQAAVWRARVAPKSDSTH